MGDHAVLIHLPFAGRDLSPIFELEDALINAIEGSNVGDVDGNDVGQGVATLYMYGTDADALFRAIEPTLRASGLPRGSVAVKRYGRPGAREQRVALA